jgi:predicted AAA+ superfamily ATPase
MKRFALDDLVKWKSNPNKKPLIIRGARQVGKTWLMREFGRICYESTIYINFDDNNVMAELFSRDLDVDRIIRGIELAFGIKIIPESTLLIFDEVQETPKALTSLKYFNENAPQYQIVAAGSLLGVALHHGTSFPVGKVDFLDLYPLSYGEFLCAVGKENLVELLNSGDFSLISVFRDDYIDRLKEYYFVGGMPEAVADFAQNTDYGKVREIQNKILTAYELDFSKHAPANEVPRIRMVWNSIPAQLAKENKKFIYGQVREGARAKDYELVLMWLSDCGLIHKINRAAKPDMPLKAYEDMKAFKVYMLDVGLLSCAAGIDAISLLKGNTVFIEFKGALTEQYVCQQLKTLKSIPIFYWTSESGNAEIDFVVQLGSRIVPLEVKAEVNLQSKSLKVYREKYSPDLSIRSSMLDYKHEGWLLNLPLYAVGNISSCDI